MPLAAGKHNCTMYSNFRNYAPPPILIVNMPPLFLRAVFSKFFGRRCLVEGLVSSPAHPVPSPKKLSTPGPKKWQNNPKYDNLSRIFYIG